MVEITKDDFMQTAPELRELSLRRKDAETAFQKELQKLGLSKEWTARIEAQVREIAAMWMKVRHNG